MSKGEQKHAGKRKIKPRSPWVVFVIGGPGSSASQLCSEMARAYGFVHLNTAEAIRKEIASGSKCGNDIIHAISQGRVPIDSTIEVIMKAIMNSIGSRILVDGFPQDIEQAQSFEESIGAVQCVIYIKCSRREMQRRLLAANDEARKVRDASLVSVHDVRKSITEFEDNIDPVLTFYSLSNKVHVLKDGPSMMKLSGQARNILGGYPAPSRTLGTQTEAGLLTDQGASNANGIITGAMTEKPSPFLNGTNVQDQTNSFVRGGDGPINVDPAPPRNASIGGAQSPRVRNTGLSVAGMPAGPRSELEKWFGRINVLCGPATQWRNNFANGFLVAQILENYFPQEVQSVGFHTGVSSQNKRDNWRQLQQFFLKYDCVFNDGEITGMMQAKRSAVVPFLMKVHAFLANQGLVARFDKDKVAELSKSPRRKGMKSMQRGAATMPNPDLYDDGGIRWRKG